MRRFIALVAAGAVLTLALAPAATAKTTRVPVDGNEVLAEVTSAGSMAMDGSIVSLRGAVWVFSAAGSDLIAGTDTVVINYDIDTATGMGSLWGKNRIEPTAHPGGRFDCSWTGTFVLTHWTGNGVCHGAGSLDRWQLRLTIVAEPGGEADTLGGFAFLPGS